MRTTAWRRQRAALAFCILHVALGTFAASGCAKSPPAAPSAPVDPLARLQRDLSDATRRPGVARGVWGVVVHSLDRNERLFELNARALLVPASAAKLASVATAAEAVGWDYRYETTVRAMGPIVDGTLQGDLLVTGTGDPTIGGRAGSGLATWIDALKAAGIRRIGGRVIGDDNTIEEPRPQLAWAWDDLGYTAGALFGALNVAENRLTVTVGPGPAAGSPATISLEPHAAGRPLINRAVTGPSGGAPSLWPEQRPGEPFLTIAGTIPAGAPPARLTVSAGNPTLWFASVLRNQLLRSGIEVSADAWDIDDVMPTPDASTGTVLYVHRSAPLAEIVQPLMKDSINLYAEAVMRLNAAPGTFPTNDAALDGFRKRLAAWGAPVDGQQLIDGSGLSRRDTVAAETLLLVLQRFADPTAASPFVRSLPVAGVDGSLENRMRGTAAAGNVRAKTGTMSNIRSLAGYATTRDGERLAFVAMVNNFEGPGASANQALDAIAVLLADFARAAPR